MTRSILSIEAKIFESESCFISNYWLNYYFKALCIMNVQIIWFSQCCKVFDHLNLKKKNIYCVRINTLCNKRLVKESVIFPKPYLIIIVINNLENYLLRVNLTECILDFSLSIKSFLHN